MEGIWKEHVSRTTGLKYWFNPKTGESRYESPLTAITAAPTPMPTITAAPHNKAADWYSAIAIADRGMSARTVSNILHLRSLNNWIKATLIRECAPQPCTSVLDLACGKLGDIKKWQKAGVRRYCGIDIARGALEKGCERFNSIAAGSGMSAKLAEADLGYVDLSASGFLGSMEVFDCISVQFALHYFFRSELSALTFFNNISGRLRPGGVFLGTLPDAAVLVRRLRDQLLARNPVIAGAQPGTIPSWPPTSDSGSGGASALSFGNSVYSVTFEEASARAQWSLGSQPYGCAYSFYLGGGEDDVRTRLACFNVSHRTTYDVCYIANTIIRWLSFFFC